MTEKIKPETEAKKPEIDKEAKTKWGRIKR